jgi:sterol desaturase/sphingolipid hydroxylase (fatty acid hydroxylase superfamily)
VNERAAMENPISNSARALIIGTWSAGLLWLERRRALRAVRRSKLQRDVRNILIAAPAGVVMQAVEMPLALTLATFANRRHLGVLPLLSLPSPASTVASILLLDYTLYWWHFLAHRVPVLWRFHQVHHIDREMDATTALRFHFGEITVSLAFRALQMLVIGPTPQAVALWQVFMFLCILFHHSNVRLPVSLERLLARIVVTPRLHGIHHSVASQEVNSNWSSGLTVWDWLHSTLRTEPTQDGLILGVAGFLGPGEVTAIEALKLPFEVAGQPPEYDGMPVRQSLDSLS